MKNILKLGIVSFWASLLLSSCLKYTVNKPSYPLQDIYSTISNSTGYSILSVAIIRAGLKDSLATGNGPYTLFAPSNIAFSFYGVNTLTDLNKISADSLKKILSYHVIKAYLTTQLFPKEPDSSIMTLAGYRAYLTTGTHYFFINGNIVNPPANYACSNGIIQPINGILNLPAATISATLPNVLNLHLFNAAIIKAGLVNLLNGAGTHTVFAPSDSVFTAAGYKSVSVINNSDPAVLAKLLNYHLTNGNLFSDDLIDNSSLVTLQGGSIKVGNKISVTLTGNSNKSAATAVNLNIITTNGVIYIINKILTP